MRKILTGALVLATAAVVSVVSPSTDASAAVLSETTVKVNAVNQTLTVKASGCKEVGFSVATVNAKTGIIKPVADSAWEWHDVEAGKDVVIDLSSLSNTKDNFVQVKTDTEERMTIKIPAVNTKVKAAYDAAANTVTVLDTTTNKAGVAVTDKIEYKNKYGSWAEYTGAAALESYTYKGAALTFRIAASASDAVAAKGADDAKIAYQVTKTETVEEPYYIASAFPGKEVKVSVKKLANGPKIAANYVKNTITIPKGAEYRITSIDATALGTWTQLADITKAEALDAATVAAKAGTIEVRTKAVAGDDKKAGKPASKVSRLSFDAVEVFNAKIADATKQLLLNGNSLTDIDVADVTVGDNGITVEYARDKKGNATGIIITNNTTDAYQVFVDKDAKYGAGKTPVVPAGDVKAVAVGAATVKGETTTAKKVTIAKCDNAQIFIRKAGNAKSAVWATAYIGLGTVKFPAVATPSPEPTATAEPAA